MAVVQPKTHAVEIVKSNGHIHLLVESASIAPTTLSIFLLTLPLVIPFLLTTHIAFLIMFGVVAGMELWITLWRHFTRTESVTKPIYSHFFTYASRLIPVTDAGIAAHLKQGLENRYQHIKQYQDALRDYAADNSPDFDREYWVDTFSGLNVAGAEYKKLTAEQRRELTMRPDYINDLGTAVKMLQGDFTEDKKPAVPAFRPGF